MNSRERVVASLNHKKPDRLPIRHLAEKEVNDLLFKHFNISEYEQLLKILGDDFKSIEPSYCGPEIKNTYNPANAETVSEPGDFTFGKVEWYDYSTAEEQCRIYSDYARIFGYV